MYALRSGESDVVLPSKLGFVLRGVYKGTHAENGQNGKDYGPDGVRTYLDASLKRFDTVFPACGSANSAIELTPDELAAAAQGFEGWVDVCKGWREEE